MGKRTAKRMTERHGGGKRKRHAAKVIETAAMMKTAAKVAKVASEESAPRQNVASA